MISIVPTILGIAVLAGAWFLTRLPSGEPDRVGESRGALPGEEYRRRADRRSGNPNRRHVSDRRGAVLPRKPPAVYAVQTDRRRSRGRRAYDKAVTSALFGTV